MSGKRTTIYDIAAEFKVSASTITRALNGKAGVSEELRRQIVRRATELGYRTNRLAKSLTRGKIKIGMIINNRFPEFHTQVAEGARRAAKELADFNVEGEVVLLPRADLYKRVTQEARRMADEGFDGIILDEFGMTAQHLAEFPGTVLQNQQRLLKNMPVQLSEEDIRSIYAACMG